MLDRLARLLTARRRLVLALTVVLVALAGAFGGPVAGILDDDGDFEDSASESVIAAERISEATGTSASPGLVVLARLGAPVDSQAGAAKVAGLARTLREDPGVATVVAYQGEGRGPRALVSRDGRSTYLLASFRPDRGGAALERIQDELRDAPGVTLGGAELAGDQVGEQVSEDLGKAEALAFPILFLLSLWVFRGMVAALLPLAVGITTVLTTFLLMRGVNAHLTGLSIFALNLIIGLGLGLAIDYSLFMVSRFREELERRGGDRLEALRATMRTAGRTVLFSAGTVAAALASLTVFPQRFLYSMGIGGALVALVAAAVSLTVLPALLAALGPRVNALSPKRWRLAAHRDATDVHAGFWYRLSRFVMRRPGRVAAASALLLIVVGLPFDRIEFTGVDASVLPPTQSARVVDDALRTEFRANAISSVYASIAAPAGARAEVERYAAGLRELPGAAAVEPVGDPAGGRWRVDVLARGPALGDRAKELVEAIRDQPAPFPVLVGGRTAQFVDQQASLGDRAPVAGAILAVTTLVILFVMTGSIVLPLKTLLMNVLTISAAFGLLVLIFQDGRLEGLLGFSSQGALESTQPILLFAIAFGLSTDYGVFLLTRIKEARDGGAADDEAVALGIERTGRIVTSAAVLFCVAIGAFATSEIIFIKEVGVGTALAVLIDATIVRALLVPSLMKLLGHRNWWAPRPLARLHRRIGVSEGEPAGA